MNLVERVLGALDKQIALLLVLNALFEPMLVISGRMVQFAVNVLPNCRHLHSLAKSFHPMYTVMYRLHRNDVPFNAKHCARWIKVETGIAGHSVCESRQELHLHLQYTEHGLAILYEA